MRLFLAVIMLLMVLGWICAWFVGGAMLATGKRISPQRASIFLWFSVITFAGACLSSIVAASPKEFGVAPAGTWIIVYNWSMAVILLAIYFAYRPTKEQSKRLFAEAKAKAEAKDAKSAQPRMKPAKLAN